MKDESEYRYCVYCDSRKVLCERDKEDNYICDCGSALTYESHDDYVDEMVDWLEEKRGLSEEEVTELIREHGNPSKGQVLAILRKRNA